MVRISVAVTTFRLVLESDDSKSEEEGELFPYCLPPDVAVEAFASADERVLFFLSLLRPHPEGSAGCSRAYPRSRWTRAA
jgi:hypothetical protein